MKEIPFQHDKSSDGRTLIREMLVEALARERESLEAVIGDQLFVRSFASLNESVDLAVLARTIAPPEKEKLFAPNAGLLKDYARPGFLWLDRCLAGITAGMDEDRHALRRFANVKLLNQNTFDSILSFEEKVALGENAERIADFFMKVGAMNPEVIQNPGGAANLLDVIDAAGILNKEVPQSVRCDVAFLQSAETLTRALAEKDAHLARYQVEALGYSLDTLRLAYYLNHLSKSEFGSVSKDPEGDFKLFVQKVEEINDTDTSILEAKLYYETLL